VYIYKRITINPKKKNKGKQKKSIYRVNSNLIFNEAPECYLTCNINPDSNKLGFPLRSLQDKPVLYPNQLKIISKEFLLKWNFFCQRITDHVYEDLREMRDKQRYDKYRSGIIK